MILWIIFFIFLCKVLNVFFFKNVFSPKTWINYDILLLLVSFLFWLNWISSSCFCQPTTDLSWNDFEPDIVCVNKVLLPLLVIIKGYFGHLNEISYNFTFILEMNLWWQDRIGLENDIVGHLNAYLAKIDSDVQNLAQLSPTEKILLRKYIQEQAIRKFFSMGKDYHFFFPKYAGEAPSFPIWKLGYTDEIGYWYLPTFILI